MCSLEVIQRPLSVNRSLTPPGSRYGQGGLVVPILGQFMANLAACMSSSSSPASRYARSATAAAALVKAVSVGWGDVVVPDGEVPFLVFVDRGLLRGLDDLNPPAVDVYEVVRQV